MKSLNLFLLVILGIGLSGCLSIHSETREPQTPSEKEKVIVVPDTTEKEIKVVPEKSY
ncbi:hypothetical protein [Nitrosomonas communis]|uniref:Lipoprotein n=1 Tax=Nitrosomonas communis TaxID=44574 RepID=A0A1H2ZIU9_9PROT|nr:hypothetical protein [Nitrosomonas communis]SDX16694.1 hypothetical protein SAMN05421882_10769 [Nitrosomonas communis]